MSQMRRCHAARPFPNEAVSMIAQSESHKPDLQCYFSAGRNLLPPDSPPRQSPVHRYRSIIGQFANHHTPSSVSRFSRAKKRPDCGGTPKRRCHLLPEQTFSVLFRERQKKKSQIPKNSGLSSAAVQIRAGGLSLTKQPKYVLSGIWQHYLMFSHSKVTKFRTVEKRR